MMIRRGSSRSAQSSYCWIRLVPASGSPKLATYHLKLLFESEKNSASLGFSSLLAANRRCFRWWIFEPLCSTWGYYGRTKGTWCSPKQAKMGSKRRRYYGTSWLQGFCLAALPLVPSPMAPHDSCCFSLPPSLATCTLRQLPSLCLHWGGVSMESPLQNMVS